MGIISSEIIGQIRDKTDIVQIVSEHVRLIASGSSYKALCPFHKEKTPSFHVISEKQIFHCFGCGKGGDVFSFVMELEHLTFPEAVKLLAEKPALLFPVRMILNTRKTRMFSIILIVLPHFMRPIFLLLQLARVPVNTLSPEEYQMRSRGNSVLVWPSIPGMRFPENLEKRLRILNCLSAVVL